MAFLLAPEILAEIIEATGAAAELGEGAAGAAEAAGAVGASTGAGAAAAGGADAAAGAGAGADAAGTGGATAGAGEAGGGGADAIEASSKIPDWLKTGWKIFKGINAAILPPSLVGSLVVQPTINSEPFIPDITQPTYKNFAAPPPPPVPHIIPDFIPSGTGPPHIDTTPVTNASFYG